MGSFRQQWPAAYFGISTEALEDIQGKTAGIDAAVDEWLVGCRRQFGGQISVDASFIQRRYRHRLCEQPAEEQQVQTQVIVDPAIPDEEDVGRPSRTAFGRHDPFNRR